jgi:hypothetical protein
MPIDSVTLRLRADRLTVAAHGNAWVEFTNTMALPGSRRLIQGRLSNVRRNQYGAVELIVDGRFHAVYGDTLVNITTAELS